MKHGDVRPTFFSPDALQSQVDGLLSASTCRRINSSYSRPKNILMRRIVLVLLASAAVLSTVASAENTASSSQSNDTPSPPSGLHVWFKLDRPSGSSYRRPYLAVWLEDSEGFPVKTATLWIQTEQPGPRWHRDLTRWYRNDRMRKIVEKTDLVDGISGATRGPGDYETHFDGTDNSGTPLPHGTYTLCLEAARENGTYKIIRTRVQLGESPIQRTELQGNIEIPQAAYAYVPPTEK